MSAVERYGCDGVGFVFSETDPYAGVDLDDCMGQENELGPTAQAIVKDFDTYTEISPSGVGACTVSCAARCRQALASRPCSTARRSSSTRKADSSA